MQQVGTVSTYEVSRVIVAGFVGSAYNLLPSLESQSAVEWIFQPNTGMFSY